ncbi:hypothetical protein [Mycobacterium genavense]|uniref:hypothetical protein n=1 Tax=Mycobacterium genavense TaxID=36812 RepID=UPI0004BC430D|nr:hypothetical protein [Mycobacterium genavense]
MSAALAVPSLFVMPAPLIRTRFPERLMATHHCANLASSARRFAVGCQAEVHQQCDVAARQHGQPFDYRPVDGAGFIDGPGGP